jgi:hypothetical protein
VTELTEAQEREVFYAQAIYEHAKEVCSPKAIQAKYDITRKQRLEIIEKWSTEKNYTS